MAEKEMQAHDMVRRRSWSRAIALYDQILAPSLTTSSATAAIATTPTTTPAVTINITRTSKDRQIACLLGRCECLLELNKYENCLADARKVLALLADQTAGECLASVSRARRWLIHALCKLKKYTEAEQMLREWINELSGQQSFLDISKTLERYKSIIQMINGHKSTQKISQSRLEDEMSILDTKLDHWATNNLPLDKYSKLLSNKGLKKREPSTAGSSSGGTATQQHNGSVSNSSSNSSSSIISISSNSSSSSSGSGSGNSSTATTTAMQKTTDLLAAIKVTGGKHLDDNDNGTTCSYCAITFQTRNELRQHCQTETHQNVIMSDEGRDWKWRPPPRGFTLDSYSLCEAYSESQSCHYGNQCVEAHGPDELNEWKERFEYRRMRLQKACEKELYGKSYTEQILERWIQATAPERIMCEKIDGVETKCEQELVTSISSRTSKREWVFVLKTHRALRAVALLQDAHRNHFAIKSIKLDVISLGARDLEIKSDQEWVKSRKTSSAASSTASCDKDDLQKKKTTSAITAADGENAADTVTSTETSEHHITIEFHTDIYGTFRQAICFDFGTEPLLVKHLCVDVVPVGDAEKIEEIKRDIINSSVTRWDVSNTNLVKFETTIGTHLKTEAYLDDLKHEKEMLERYPCPRAQTFTLTQSTIVEKRLTQNNYRSRIHELLYVEEIARYEQIARYNVRTKLTVTTNYILTPAGMATSTAKYSLANELFALMRLGKDISEDTSAGRLILSNCSSVYISGPEEPNTVAAATLSKDKRRNVYEALIEDKGKNVIYLKLSAKCVEGMGLKADTDVEVDIQFQLNRLPYCEWHNAVDKITDFKLIFPTTEIEPNIPWTPKKQWSDACEPKLNAKQREAVNAITTSLSIKLPPILLIGPFGTGKTYTLAQAIKQLLTQPEAKILICTHSNSAADLYIKEYLHPWIEEGIEEATPLRVYYHKRWVATVNSVVQKYCISDGAGNFRRPTVEDIMNHRIVVVTLSISMELASLGLPKGYFTHIFLDEAAQAMECEAIMPLALANDSTRIVLAGDHMQMSPELFSAFAKERKLHISLLERLYDHFPSNFPCKILLCENYRAHEAIIKFTSELFYEQKLIASGKQPRHDRFYPLTFFTTRGEDVQDKNSTAFYNNAEVYEVVERVSDLRKKWPSSWGKMNDASIGIMTPYADQVFRIRSELRKRRMGGISVERVLNVQGKQFRAVFLSTVRTRRTCMPLMTGNPGNALTLTEDADYGFLSNSKLLNTAITRAQSLVAVVGDPVALCSIGRCRKVWERFIEICDESKSLFGITWSFLRSQLDGVELKRGYVLNPLAPEFIPRSLQPEAYLRDQAAMYLMSAAAANNHHGGQHPGPHHNAGPMPPHGGMMGGPGGGQMQPHHAAMAAANQQMPPHMYGPQQAAAAAAYSAAAVAMMNQGLPGGKGGHHFPGHPNHMNMRAMGPPPQHPGPGGGPQQPPPPPIGQQFNMRGPPPPPSAVHMPQQPPPGSGGQFNQYMPWQQSQQQLRGGLPPGGGGGYPPPSAGQQQGPGPQNQNPNAILWGPPPQSNPWSALPKQAMPPQPPNASNGRPMPLPTQQQQQAAVGMRGGSVPLQPPPNQQQMRATSSDLGYLAKKAYGNAPPQHQQPPPPGTQPPPPHPNFAGYAGGGGGNVPPPPPPNQMQMLNQRNVGGIPNGPISPMDPFMQQRSVQAPGQHPAQNNFFGNNNVTGLKDKDFQFLNNVHVPLNIGGTMFQAPPSSSLANNKQQSPTTLRFPQPQDYAALLPPNMNIYEMAFEPKESQYKWYLKLLETHGQEAASKFTEVLRQVMTMLHQQQQQHQQQPNKPTPSQLQPPHMNAAAPNQMLPRELMQQQGMPPMGMGGMGGSVGNPLNHHQQQQQQQQQQRNNSGMHPFMNHGPPTSQQQPQPPPSLLPPPIEDASQLDGNINFNQQIDLVFNSLMNGNEISQPILRDLLGIVGGGGGVGGGGSSGVSGSGNAGGVSSSNIMNNVNGDYLLPPSSSIAAQQQQQQHQNKGLFPGIGGGVGIGGGSSQPQQQQPLNMQKLPPPHMFPMQQQMQQPPHHMQSSQQQQQQGFMGGNSMLSSKDLLLGVGANSSGNSMTSATSVTAATSVPLYRRQAMTMGNGNMGGMGTGGMANYNGGSNHPSASVGGHSMSSSTPDNILTGGTNDLLAGLGTNAGNLIEALFQTSATLEQQQQQHQQQQHQHQQQQQQQGNNSFQKLLYNNYNAAAAMKSNDLFMRGTNVGGGEQHHAGGGGPQDGIGGIATTVPNNHHAHAQHFHHNNSGVVGGSGGGGGTTYAAVLSQGQQQPGGGGGSNQAVAHHHNYHAEASNAGVVGGSIGGGGTSNAGHGHVGEVGEKDLFASIRELGQGTNGFYNYFQ